MKRVRTRRDYEAEARKQEKWMEGKQWIGGRLTFRDHCGVGDLKWQPPVKREKALHK